MEFDIDAHVTVIEKSSEALLKNPRNVHETYQNIL